MPLLITPLHYFSFSPWILPLLLILRLHIHIDDMKATHYGCHRYTLLADDAADTSLMAAII